MKIRKIVSGAEYRMDEHFQNFIILGILIIWQIKKKNLISKVDSLENSQNFYGKLVILQIAIIDWFEKWSNIRNCSIWKLINFSNLTFWKFKNNIKCYNLENF